MKLYLKNFELEDEIDEKSFLLNYFNSQNETTFYDKKCKDIQCFRGKLRSFSDMFRLTKTYFPNLKLDKFAYILISIVKGSTAYRQDILDELRMIDFDLSNCETVEIEGDSIYKIYGRFDYDYNGISAIYCPDIGKVVISYEGWNLDDWIEGRYVLNFDMIGYGVHPNRHTRGGRLSFENIIKMAKSYEDKIAR